MPPEMPCTFCLTLPGCRLIRKVELQMARRSPGTDSSSANTGIGPHQAAPSVQQEALLPDVAASTNSEAAYEEGVAITVL